MLRNYYEHMGGYTEYLIESDDKFYVWDLQFMLFTVNGRKTLYVIIILLSNAIQLDFTF